jgi:2-C-methyl-D-erythritol 4-phosphate cytidylyltransferase
MDQFVIIVAGGKGIRMGAGIPKQFLLLAGKPMLMYTINSFHRWNPNVKIILVLPESEIIQWSNLKRQYNFDVPHDVIPGGETRFHSVKNGLQTILSEDGIVAVHDGVRPLISIELIERIFLEAEKKGNAIPAIAVRDSIRIVENNINKSVDREQFKAIQTPQAFKLKILRKAYLQGFHQKFTDDASVVEALGEKINLTEGEIQNLKITLPEDILFAEAILKINL